MPLGSHPRPPPQNGIYDPGTQRPAPDGSIVRDLFPDNTIPMRYLDPVALKIESYIPLPSGPLANQLINNYAVPVFSNYRPTTIPSVKLDHSISPKIKVSGHYSLNAHLLAQRQRLHAGVYQRSRPGFGVANHPPELRPDHNADDAAARGRGLFRKRVVVINLVHEADPACAWVPAAVLLCLLIGVAATCRL